jgi:phosphomannomutase
MKISIRELMAQSGVAFGTSGARGLATAMTDRVCFAYTRGFLQHLEAIGELHRGGETVAVGGDFRPSTDRVMEAVCRAAESLGYRALNCGKTPSPALALLAFTRRIPAIMVTGSHIPDDRNGIKFNKCSSEVLKEDEAGMSAQVVELDETLFDASGAFAKSTAAHRTVDAEATRAYIRRYLDFFSPTALTGLCVGVYQHSSVGRDVLVEILRGLGAEVTPLGRSEQFIPVDTEAIRPEDVGLALRWADENRFDAIVSADGDSDRPLISDERGRWLRGDVAGILCAKFLGADSISTPVSCNTAVEKCGWFHDVRRTRIGSPFVVASMTAATATGARCAVGYEANGGFLLNSPVTMNGRTLAALPTRDAVIVMLGILLLAKRGGKTVSALTGELPARFTASDRLKQFPIEKSREILARFSSADESANRAALEEIFSPLCGGVREINRTDGVRVTFGNAEVIHMRPSGNAPEFRCYTEAATEERSSSLNVEAMQRLAALAGL